MENNSFKGQFILTSDQTITPPQNWKITELPPYNLYSDLSLPLIEIVSQENYRLGWLIGYPINTADSILIQDKLALKLNDSSTLDFDAIESQLYSLGGRFVAIISTASGSRLYLDPSGSLSAVYSSESPTVASTPDLLLKTSQLSLHSQPFLETLKSAKSSSGTWYPCGFTPLENVKVLLPNHFLDLHSFQTKRHYPKNNIQPTATWTESENLATEIAKYVANNIHAIANNYPLNLSLTAGKDSRMLLACSRHILHQLSFSTVYTTTEDVDFIIAEALADAFKLNLKKVPRIQRDLLDSDLDKVALTGFAGEVGRGFYWRKGDKQTTQLHPEDLLKRLQYPGDSDLFLKEAELWLSDISHLNPFFILDLMYIEHRLGCCMGQVMYSYDQRFKFSLYPINHRQIFEAMFRLGISYKKKGFIANGVCQSQWAELLDIPFNRTHFTLRQKLLNNFYKLNFFSNVNRKQS
jgi:hypothetical protein